MPKVNVTCTGPIALSRKYSCIWEDVYINWNIKPGRKNKKYLAPTLMSRTDIERDIELLKKEQKSVGKSYGSNINLDEVELCEEDEIEYNKEILQELDKGNIFIQKDMDDSTPDVVTPKEYIDRDEAERMLTKLLEEWFGLKNIKFKWKRPNFVIIPT